MDTQFSDPVSGPCQRQNYNLRTQDRMGQLPGLAPGSSGEMAGEKLPAWGKSTQLPSRAANPASRGHDRAYLCP